ncbi:hypothetical protein CY34DRAFT_18274 [Suillus luteus UH-Slu-Lm8-n1]|uniref:Zn(2)-C6 fungal-type domain-containing protein n=1 Tax=Suillus luteus UH-Slu-Lm8-n1 TaxID=930992 RepID=A0A0D0ANL4_9AGAM|nr:hypothetical protein CY34DRAFT_18274 [Suillus luteus UH-Slu-Lm8-n1]
MSTPVQSSLASLQASTAQLVDIITRARLTPAGTGEIHFGLTAQATTLMGVDEGEGHDSPGVASCFRELMRVRAMTPRVWPNWHSIGHDDPRISKHSWCSKIQAWDALGDHSCDLPVVPNPSTAPLTIDLPSPLPIPSAPVHPSPPVIPSAPVPQFPPGLAGPSTAGPSGFQDKGKGKVVDVSLTPEVGGSRKRKSPLISGDSSQPPKSTMKSHKWPKSTRIVKSKPIVESEDDEDTIIQPISCGVPEVVLPWISTLAQGTPQSPRSPRSPKKKSFGPASLTAGSRPDVPDSPSTRPEVAATSGRRPEAPEDHDIESNTSDGDPPAIGSFNITVPGPNNPCHYCVKANWPCATRFDRRRRTPCVSCIRCASKKIKCQPEAMGSPPPRTRAGGKSTTCRTCSTTPAPKSPATSQSRARTRSQSHGPFRPPAVPAVTTPRVQSRGQSKTVTSTKAPVPTPAPAIAPGPSLSVAVPRAALDVPMPDLHSMAIAIQDGAARIAILEARVLEQEGKIDTLQRLHESLRRQVVAQHPSFPLPDMPANSSFLLDQSVPPLPSMSPLPSALPPLINLDMDDMAVMEPTLSNIEDGSDMIGPMFEPSQVQPESPQTSGEVVVPDNPGNLVPEYNSVSEEMDIEVPVEPAGGEVDMAT